MSKNALIEKKKTCGSRGSEKKKIDGKQYYYKTRAYFGNHTKGQRQMSNAGACFPPVEKLGGATNV